MSKSIEELSKEERKCPTDIRRTTIFVEDMERSLLLYRDALGLEVYYDQPVTLSGDGLAAGVPGTVTRLVLMRANDPWVGVLGLLELQDLPLEPPATPKEKLGIGDIVLVLHNNDLEASYEKAIAVPGVRNFSAPHVSEYPQPDGNGVIRVMGTSFWDPDGIFVEMNQVMT